MAEGYKIWVECPYCINGKQKTSGTTEESETIEIDCPQCGGLGYRFFGWCSVDTFTMPGNLPESES